MSDKSSSLSTLASNIREGVQNALKDLHTSMPGIIQSFDSEQQTVSVQPAIRRIFVTRDGEKEILVPTDLPVLINVPINFPRGGGFSLTFPVAPGDECLIVFCERSIDAWHESGEVKKPSARRFHSLSDAVALVGLSSLPNKIPDYDDTNVQLKKDDSSVYIRVNNDSSLDIHAESNVNISTDANIVGTCQNVSITASGSAQLTAPTITLNGNTSVNGTLTVSGTTTAPTVAASSSLTVGGKEMAGHTHTGSPTAPDGPQSNTGGPA